MSCLLFPLALLFIFLPFWLFRRAAFNRARANGLKPLRYLAIAAVGWWLGVVVGYITVAMIYFDMSPPSKDWAVPLWIAFLGVCVCGTLGAASGPGLSYLLLWMRTSRDSDYDDRESQITNIHQPRDRDDVGPK